MKDDGEAAILREITACEEEERTGAERYLKSRLADAEYREAYQNQKARNTD